MADLLFRLYLLALPAVTCWAVWRGLGSDRPELARSAGVVLIHAALMQLAAAAWPPVAGQGYPFLLIAATLAGSLWLICLTPAGRGNAVLGGSVLFGILAALIYGVHSLARGPSAHADWNLWLAQFTMGWANLLILLGWTHERAVRRVADLCLDRIAGLVHAASAGGVAR